MVVSLRTTKRMPKMQVKKMEQQKITEKSEEEKVKDKLKEALNPAIFILKGLIKK